MRVSLVEIRVSGKSCLQLVKRSRERLTEFAKNYFIFISLSL